MQPTEENIAIILAELKRGEKVRRGGSRSYTYVGFNKQGWFTGGFDEGDIEEVPCSEEVIVAQIKRQFPLFLRLLGLPHQREIGLALHAGAHRVALHHLAAWQQTGDFLRPTTVLRAYLQWPSKEPNDKQKQLIREDFKSFLVYHAFMRFVDYQITVENGLLGLKIVDTLRQIVVLLL